jgi:hypothetical protein
VPGDVIVADLTEHPEGEEPKTRERMVLEVGAKENPGRSTRRSVAPRWAPRSPSTWPTQRTTRTCASREKGPLRHPSA